MPTGTIQWRGEIGSFYTYLLSLPKVSNTYGMVLIYISGFIRCFLLSFVIQESLNSKYQKGNNTVYLLDFTWKKL